MTVLISSYAYNWTSRKSTIQMYLFACLLNASIVAATPQIHADTVSLTTPVSSLIQQLLIHYQYKNLLRERLGLDNLYNKKLMDWVWIKNIKIFFILQFDRR